MSGIKLWQYLVIGGPAFLLGIITAVSFLKEERRALEQLEQRILDREEW